MGEKDNYNNWTRDGLLKRVRELERQLKKQHGITNELATNGQAQEQKPLQKSKSGRIKGQIDPSKYATRFIALKFAYLGKNYGPFEYSPRSLKPSIEEMLWKALTTACLIFPEDPNVVDFGCCEYAKCGRTDVGVSSFGQVVSLRVRSNRPVVKRNSDGGATSPHGASTLEAQQADDVVMKSSEMLAGVEDGADDTPRWDPIRDEIDYCKVLNRILPDDIRVYAWCPTLPPNFNARFSCRERQYRYFFTQPAFLPVPSQLEPPLRAGQLKPGWLDVEAMREAAKFFEGRHDLRNFCQVDGTKALENFTRDIYSATIEEVSENASALAYLSNPTLLPRDGSVSDGPFPRVYSFNVNGSGFLWHQIRRMVGILFLVGQRLEEPSIIKRLLDVTKNPTQPLYNMADEAPLVLWDCIFPDPKDPERKEALPWVYSGDQAMLASKYGPGGTVESLWARYRERKLDEVLAHQLLQRLGDQGRPLGELPIEPGTVSEKETRNHRLFLGGNSANLAGKYIPVMERKRMASVEEINDREAKRKGFADADAFRASKRKGGRGGIEADVDE